MIAFGSGCTATPGTPEHARTDDRPKHELFCKGTETKCGSAAALLCLQHHGTGEYEFVEFPKDEPPEPGSHRAEGAVLLVACGE